MRILTVRAGVRDILAAASSLVGGVAFTGEGIMDQHTIAKRVARVIARHLHVEGRPVEPSMHFVDDLGADSLALVDLTLALEEAFDIDIDGDDVESLCTVDDAIRYVDRCLEAVRRRSVASPDARGRSDHRPS
jgi:acyl carrier protein